MANYPQLDNNQITRPRVASDCSSTSSTSGSRRRRVGSWRTVDLDSRDLTSVRLLWNNTDLPHIWDVDFLQDGTVLVVAGKEALMEAKVVTIYSRQLYAISLTGSIEPLPFPNNFSDPGGVAVCRSTGSIAVTDAPGGEERGTVSVLKRVGQSWKFSTHGTHNTALRLALTPADVAVCAVRWEKLVKYTGSRNMWTKSISSSNDLVPYIAIDSNEHIIISTPANNRVSVVNSKGDLMAAFPTWFIKKPTGVCVDYVGRVYIADKSSRTVSHFTSKGHFIQTVVEMEVEPRCISIYEDCFLVVGTNCNGTYLYQLEWE